MAADVKKASNFLLTSDYPIDQVVFLNSGSATIPFPTAGFTITIPHNLPFIPLVGGSWDVTPTFDTNYDYYTGTIPSPSPISNPFNVELDIMADSTNIIISPINLSGLPIVVYYRIFALEPSDSQADVPFTAANGSSFIINTDYNYTKLYKEGVINSPAHPSINSIVHNLGYPPQVMTWVTALGVRYPVSITSIYTILNEPSDVGVIVTNDTVDFSVGSSSNSTRIDYRIYIDETGND